MLCPYRHSWPATLEDGMIGSLRGRLLDLRPGACLLEAGGVGYACLISLQTFSHLSGTEGEVFLWTHTHVREDALQLIGFATPHERELFTRLTSISGIGPRVALQVLSRYPAEELAAAIIGGDVAALVAIPGVGKKTAERIILELKGSLPAADVPSPATVRLDAESALVNLGYTPKVARMAVEAALKDRPEGPLEALIVLALRRLA